MSRTLSDDKDFGMVPPQAKTAETPSLYPPPFPSIVDFLFVASIFLYPCNGAIALGFLGEAGSEPFVLINFLILPFALISLALRRHLVFSSIICVFALLFILAIAISGLANIETIMGAQLKGRTGLDRLFSATLVPIFGFYFASLVYIYARRDFRRFIGYPLFFGAIMVAGVGVVELMSWASNSIYEIYVTISHSVLHGLMRRGEFIIGRIQSVTYEASNFGMYSMFSLPALFSLAARLPKSGQRSLSILLALCLGVLALLSGRTSFFGVLLIVCIYALCIGMYVFKLRLVYVLVLLYIAGNVLPLPLISTYQNDLVSSAVQSGNISNLSRLGTMTIQIDLFTDSPIFGVGMGQYPFYVPSKLPFWAATWEFLKWINDPQASFFPSFSVYTRLAGEMGLVGYTVWMMSWVFILTRLIRAANRFSIEQGQCPYIGVAIICGIYASLFSGWNIASFKIPYIWLTLGLAAAYIEAPGRLEIVAPRKPANTPAASRKMPAGTFARRPGGFSPLT
jgi:hypothetical protein